MKKYMILFAALSVALAACSSNESDDKVSDTTPKTSQTTSQTNNEKEATEPSEPSEPTVSEPTTVETSKAETPETNTTTKSTETTTPSSNTTAPSTPETSTQPTTPTKTTEPTEPTKTENSTSPLSSTYSNKNWTYKENGYTYNASFTFTNEQKGIVTFSVTEDATGDVVDKVANASFTMNGTVGTYTYTADQTADHYEGGQGIFTLTNDSVQFSRYQNTYTFKK